MHKRTVLAMCLAGLVCSTQAGLNIRGLSCEHVAQPMGIETAQPRFSWKLDADENGQAQTAYQILAASSPELLAGNKGDLWDSGWIARADSQMVPYAGTPLRSLQNVWWKVRVKDCSGKISDWSVPARFATGLLSGEAPAGKWISNSAADFKTGTSWFRKTVSLKKAPDQALVLLASRGYHELYVNGNKADDRALAPNASIMEKRTLYVVYDIAPLLQAGENTLAVWISPGRVAATKVEPAFLLYGKIDGQSVASDATWKTKPANVVRYFSDSPKEKARYGGEQQDDREAVPDWNKNGFNDSSWAAATARQEKTELSADIMPPTRQIETITAKKIEMLADGTVRVDFGTYCTGQLEARVHGEPGKPIQFATLADLERPNYFGQYSEVIPGESGTAVFQHRFNWMCGRWLEVSGLTGTPELADFTVHRISTDFNRIGFFQCSDELINRLYETDLYTYRNVTLDGYTHDCTTRERRGYGEEAFGTSRDMAVTYDLTAFTRKWLRDWRDVQKPDGYIPHSAPEGKGGGGTLWSSFTVLAPWNLYVQSGDLQVLEENQDSANRWMNYLQTAVKGGILTQYENKLKFDFLGDWARPVPPEDRGQEKHVANFGNSPMASAFNNGIYAFDLETMSRISGALGQPDVSRDWKNKLDTLRPAVHAKFFQPDSGVYVEPNQVFSMLMPLAGITPPADLEKARVALDAELKSKNYIDAGSSGLPVFLEYIIGHPETHQWFFDVLHRRDYPGFAYFLEQGYDNWPELWDPTCSSKIHSCYIGLSSFLIRSLAGIEPQADAPGYERFVVKPSFVRGLDKVSYEFDSPRGWINVKWERKGDEIILDLTVPPGASAEVHLPSGVQTVGGGSYHYRILL
ncbi:MAG: glycoside hydrolase family 78 protein [Kiritimatiellales bacterium]|nr:glycoside hydrolase family 78 protein [Kiritimatiellales bacterium]